jgi:hypothetical protein
MPAIFFLLLSASVAKIQKKRGKIGKAFEPVRSK